MVAINESLNKDKKVQTIKESFTAEKNTEDDLWCVKNEAGECVESGLTEEDAKAKADELNQE
ncbi:hypothetical protein [Ralstonia phage RP13]|nr:hypothetical protein [Ralstonia phage RP13]